MVVFEEGCFVPLSDYSHALRRRIADWFPDREFFMRSNGQVRFITISSKMQKIAAGLSVAALCVWAISLGFAAWSQYSARADRANLLEREAYVASAEERVQEYSKDINEVVTDLQRRQDFIDKMAPMLPRDVRNGENVSDSAKEAEKTVKKVSSVFPAAQGLAKMEARQLVFAEQVTRFADRRSARAEAALRKLHINPAIMLRPTDLSAAGGPFEALSTGANARLDPRFERMGLSLARMAALERGIEGIPQVVPARNVQISSGFGYRSDPFRRTAAMHAGLDFKGRIGTPILAAAKGVVTFVGWKAGYGRAVEITHASGLMTRYAHMSRWTAKVGDRVNAGSTIGAIGNSGRSTGPHLHFEVRINNQAVNPRLFLEKAPHVLKEIPAARRAQPDGF